MADNRIWLDTAFAKKDSASWAKDRTSVLACSLTSYRVAAGSATCGLALISATGNVCADDHQQGRPTLRVCRRSKTGRLAGGWKRVSAGWLAAASIWPLRHNLLTRQLFAIVSQDEHISGKSAVTDFQ